MTETSDESPIASPDTFSPLRSKLASPPVLVLSLDDGSPDPAGVSADDGTIPPGRFTKGAPPPPTFIPSIPSFRPDRVLSINEKKLGRPTEKKFELRTSLFDYDYFAGVGARLHQFSGGIPLLTSCVKDCSP